jgi:hypothetical protein
MNPVLPTYQWKSKYIGQNSAQETVMLVLGGGRNQTLLILWVFKRKEVTYKTIFL